MAVPFLQKAQGNGASTTASAGISNTDTSVGLTSDTAFDGEGMLIMDEGQATEEIAYGTGKVGSTVSIPLANRGLEGGSAQAHTGQFTVKGILSAGMWNNVIDALTNLVSASTGAVDTTKVVTPSGTQTLTNKTFDDPQTIKGVATPSNPSSGYVKIYAKTDNKVYKLDSSGTESELGAGGTQAETFIIPGTLAAGTDISKTWYLPFNLKITSATAYVKTEGTTNSTVFDINLDGSTIFTDKPTIASGGTSDSATADNPTTTRTAGSKVTIDIDSVSTTAPVEAYIVLFYERA